MSERDTEPPDTERDPAPGASIPVPASDVAELRALVATVLERIDTLDAGEDRVSNWHVETMVVHQPPASEHQPVTLSLPGGLKHLPRKGQKAIMASATTLGLALVGTLFELIRWWLAQ